MKLIDALSYTKLINIIIETASHASQCWMLMIMLSSKFYDAHRNQRTFEHSYIT